MNGTDFHTHLAPLLLSGFPSDPAVTRDREGAVEIDGLPVGPAELSSPEALEHHLDSAGLASAVVSVPPPCYRQHLDTLACHAWTRQINDGLLEMVRDKPRLLPLAYLPLEHPEIALEELQRSIPRSGFSGFTASAGGRSTHLDSPDLSDFWCTMEETGSPLFLHPGTSPDPRLGRHYLTNLLGNPFETTLASAQLIFGGVLRAHPGLRIVLAHGGGCLHAVLGRWQRGVDTSRPGLPHLDQTVAAEARRLFADSVVHDEHALESVLRTFGPEHVVLGSDWPYPMGVQDPVQALGDVNAAMKEAIVVRNPERLLSRMSS